MEAKHTLDRRSFLGIAAASALAATSVGLSGCTGPSAGDQTQPADSEPSKRSWEQTPDPIPSDQIKETLDCDVIVIGAGIAGLVCAHSAAMNGAETVLIEKMDTFSARGHDNGAVGCAHQKDLGLSFDTARMQRDWLQLTGCRTNVSLLNTWLNHSAEPMDYYIERMAAEGVTDIATNKGSNMDSDNVCIREYPVSIDFGATQVTEDGEGIQHRLLRFIETWAKDEGADIRYSTKAEQLIRNEEGPVTGVVASTADGYILINAAKGVVLATGDISGNDEMMQEFAPLVASCENRLYTPFGGNTGDGINMACWVGGALQKTTAAAMALPSTKASGGPLASDGVLGWLAVNKHGERYFAENSGGPSICFSTMQQPESAGYSIFDNDYATKLLSHAPDGANRNGIEYLGDLYGVNEGYEGLEDWMTKGIEEKVFFKADTLEDLARQIEADEDAFLKTVDEYNGLCESGTDTQFGKPSNYLTTVETPPFYASKIKVAVLVVPFGVNVDSHSRVCDGDDKPIEGLYAIGNVQGNFFTDSYPMIFSGISHGRGMTFGWLVGKALASDTLV